MNRISTDYLETLTPDQLGVLLIMEITTISPDMVYIRNLLDVGCPIDYMDIYKWSPLHHAVHRRHIGVVKFLISRGAGVNNRGHADRTALFFAAQFGDIEMVRFLLSIGADINARDEFSWTPWFHASGDIREAIPELEPK